MSYARTLSRAINDDLVAQIEASGKVRRLAKTSKNRGKPPRHYLTYRWAHRNISHHGWKAQ